MDSDRSFLSKSADTTGGNVIATFTKRPTDELIKMDKSLLSTLLTQHVRRGEHDTTGRQRPSFLHSLTRLSTRVVISLFLLLLAVTVLASGQPNATEEHLFVTQSSSGIEMKGVVHACTPFDVDCYLKEMADSLAINIFKALEPLLVWVENDPLNILTRTPPELTYNHPEVQKVTSWALVVVDAALLIMVGLIGYHILLGRSLGLANADLIALLPRLALAFGAAHIWWLITSVVIDLNNVLSIGVARLLGFTLLHSAIEAATLTFTNPIAGGAQRLLLVILALLFLCVQLVLLWQMLVRLALVILSVALAPLGLLCLGLPLTQSWGRLWLSMFSHTVLIQFFQVLALSLAGLLVAYVTELNPFQMSAPVTSLLVGNALLFLVVKLPGMIREYALRPILQAGEQSGSAVTGVVARVAATL